MKVSNRATRNRKRGSGTFASRWRARCANLAVAAVAVGVLSLVSPQINLWAKPYVHSSNLARSLVWVNLLLAAFNLLPAYPMDGGRVLRAVFARNMDSVSATKRAVTIGQAFATMFMLTGMLWNIWMTMIGFFLFLAAQLEERSAVFQSVLETVRLEDIMLTDFATLSPADTLKMRLKKRSIPFRMIFPSSAGAIWSE